MAVTNGFTTPPHHRQNRRRQLSDSRTHRREARPIITATKATAPLWYRDFGQCWQRWKVRQASEEIQPEIDKLQQGQERQRLFGETVMMTNCVAMLDVMMRLFGDIDYTDP